MEFRDPLVDAIAGSVGGGACREVLSLQRALEGANGMRCKYAAFTCDGPR